MPIMSTPITPAITVYLRAGSCYKSYIITQPKIIVSQTLQNLLIF